MCRPWTLLNSLFLKLGTSGLGFLFIIVEFESLALVPLPFCSFWAQIFCTTVEMTLVHGQHSPWSQAAQPRGEQHDSIQALSTWLYVPVAAILTFPSSSAAVLLPWVIFISLPGLIWWMRGKITALYLTKNRKGEILSPSPFCNSSSFLVLFLAIRVGSYSTVVFVTTQLSSIFCCLPGTCLFRSTLQFSSRFS